MNDDKGGSSNKCGKRYLVIIIVIEKEKCTNGDQKNNDEKVLEIV